jgi:hypothetical protein
VNSLDKGPVVPPSSPPGDPHGFLKTILSFTLLQTADRIPRSWQVSKAFSTFLASLSNDSKAELATRPCDMVWWTDVLLVELRGTRSRWWLHAMYCGIHKAMVSDGIDVLNFQLIYSVSSALRTHGRLLRPCIRRQRHQVLYATRCAQRGERKFWPGPKHSTGVFTNWSKCNLADWNI